jgi:hypothetical protein
MPALSKCLIVKTTTVAFGMEVVQVRDRTMKRILHFVILVVGSLVTCFPISAQMRVGVASAHSGRVQLPQPAHMRNIIRLRNNWVTRTASGTQLCCRVAIVHVESNGHPASGKMPFINGANIEIEDEVPGLGFDFPHLAAISGNFPFNRTIQQDGNRIHNNPFRPIFFTGNPDFQEVPGLGFDFPHLAAIRGNTHFNPAFEQNEIRMNDNSFAPIFFSENPDFSEFVDPSLFQQDQQAFQQQGQQQPQIIIIQQAAPVAREQLTGRVPQASDNFAAPSMAPPVAPPPATAPIRDVGEFIFVRREGRILFALAFFISEGQLHFVTPEGTRHTVPVAELDTEATRKMNEALGTTVDLHN